MVRESKDAAAKLRLNPRKDWYANVESIEVADPYTVIFKTGCPAARTSTASGRVRQ